VRVRDLGHTIDAAFCESCSSSEQCLTRSLLTHLEQDRSLNIRISHYPAGSLVIRQHEPQVGIHIVCEGSVAVFAELDHRREAVLYMGGRNAIIDIQDWVLERPTYSVSARALSTSTILFISNDDLRRLYAADPTISMIITTHLARRLDWALRRQGLQQVSEVKTRVMAVLRELVEVTGQQHAQDAHFESPINRRLLADIVGAAPETISRVLTELETTALINRKDSRISIPDVPRLMANVTNTR
jgi:CRP-like cAMP-binding protein